MSSEKFKILVLGRSGSGKSFSLHSMDPKTTGIINIDKKELSFGSKGYQTEYGENTIDLDKSNYVETGKISGVNAILDNWSQRADIKTIVIDTLTHLITSDYINNAIGKDFKAYQSMGKAIWNILDKVREINKNVIVFGHISESFNDLGQRIIDIKTQGKMISGFEPESYFTTMLFAEVRNKDGNIEYVFKTKPTTEYEKIKSPAKRVNGSVVRALDDYEPNDVNLVLNKLSKFYS